MKQRYCIPVVFFCIMLISFVQSQDQNNPQIKAIIASQAKYQNFDDHKKEIYRKNEDDSVKFNRKDYDNEDSNNDYNNKFFKNSNQNNYKVKKDNLKRLFVDVDQNRYYEATIKIDEGKLQIQILDQDLNQYELSFNSENCIKFADAYKNVIVISQVDKNSKIVSFYLIQIIWDPVTCKYYLDSFAVNPYVDDKFYNLDDSYEISQILQYNEQQQWLSVIDKNDKYLRIYKINIIQRINALLFVGWFCADHYDIDGGNTKVLYDQNNDQFLVQNDTVCANLQIQTVYNSFPVCSLTNLPLYNKGGRTISLTGWYFQYVSESKEKQCFTTFLYSGYGDQKIQGPAHLQSKKSIKYFYDTYNFVGITDCDIYVTNVYWNDTASQFQVFTITLNKAVSSPQKQKDIISDWRDAIKIIFHDYKYYILTKSKFYVYASTPKYFTKLYENDCVKDNDYDTETVFGEMKKYAKKK